MWIESNVCEYLYELGKWDEVLNKADDISAWNKEHESVYLEVTAARLKATVHVWRSQLSEAVTLEGSFLEAARTIGDPQALLPALMTTAMISAAGSYLERAVELVGEFEVCGRNSRWEQAPLLPDALRICQAAKAGRSGSIADEKRGSRY